MDEYIEREADGLTGKEFEDFNKIVQSTLNSLIRCADKHNIDRDSFVKYFSAIFGTMADVSTFERYDVKPTADVVPRAEYEALENIKEAQYAHIIAQFELIQKLKAEKDSLIRNYAECMKDYAREIFEEIDRLMLDGAIGKAYPAKVINPDKYAELKKKYIGE